MALESMSVCVKIWSQGGELSEESKMSDMISSKIPETQKGFKLPAGMTDSGEFCSAIGNFLTQPNFAGYNSSPAQLVEIKNDFPVMNGQDQQSQHSTPEKTSLQSTMPDILQRTMPDFNLGEKENSGPLPPMSSFASVFKSPQIKMERSSSLTSTGSNSNLSSPSSTNSPPPPLVPASSGDDLVQFVPVDMAVFSDSWNKNNDSCSPLSDIACSMNNPTTFSQSGNYGLPLYSNSYPNINSSHLTTLSSNGTTEMNEHFYGDAYNRAFSPIPQPISEKSVIRDMLLQGNGIKKDLFPSHPVSENQMMPGLIEVKPGLDNMPASSYHDNSQIANTQTLPQSPPSGSTAMTASHLMPHELNITKMDPNSPHKPPVMMNMCHSDKGLDLQGRDWSIMSPPTYQEAMAVYKGMVYNPNPDLDSNCCLYNDMADHQGNFMYCNDGYNMAHRLSPNPEQANMLKDHLSMPGNSPCDGKKRGHRGHYGEVMPKKKKCKTEKTDDMDCQTSPSGKQKKCKNTQAFYVNDPELRPFSCDWAQCNKSFKERKHLVVHLRIHRDERPMNCKYCPYTCRQRTSLNWHVKKNHPQLYAEYQVGRQTCKGRPKIV